MRQRADPLAVEAGKGLGGSSRVGMSMASYFVVRRHSHHPRACLVFGFRVSGVSDRMFRELVLVRSFDRFAWFVVEETGTMDVGWAAFGFSRLCFWCVCLATMNNERTNGSVVAVLTGDGICF